MEKIQALYRGRHCRAIVTPRIKKGEKIVCPYLSSSPAVIGPFFELLGENTVTASDIVYDLGSGDGSVLLEICKRTRCKVVGIDIDAVHCATAVNAAASEGLSELVTIHVKDIINVDDLSQASIVYLFLLPSCLEHVSSMIKEQCAKGTKIVVYKFPLPAEDGWEAVRSVDTFDVVNPVHKQKIWLYEV